MAASSASALQPDAVSGSACGVTVTTGTAGGHVYPGIPDEWAACDWIDADTLRQIQWFNLSDEEKKRAEVLARAMDRAKRSNPLAY